MKKILVLTKFRDELKKELEAVAPDCDFTYTSDEEATDEMFEDAEVILSAGGSVPKGIKACKRLKYIAVRAAGYEKYLVPGALPDGVVVTNARGVYSKPVAEHGLALTLSLQKNLHCYRDNQNACLWHSEGNTTSMVNAVVLVVGLGEVGAYYARLAKTLGSYVIGVKRSLGSKPEYVDELYTQNELESIISRADIVFSALPATDETWHIYDAAMFAKMKSSAIFINCGRGLSVDTEALCDALERGVIRSAACDVFEKEPLPEDSRAWKVRNLVITPHRAGYLLLEGTDRALAELLAKNLKAWLAGEKLINMIDLKTGRNI